jgi:hypothetical protein
MTDQTLALIEEHSLTIRKIPKVVITRWTHRKNQVLKDDEKLVEINGRDFVVRTRIPDNAGFWMAKKCIDMDAQVHWNQKRDNLSPTLAEAVLKASASE